MTLFQALVGKVFGSTDPAVNIFDVNSADLVGTIPANFMLMAMSDNGQKIVFVSQGNFTGQNADGNAEIFLWNEGVYTQITNSTLSVNTGYISTYISGNGSTIVFNYPANLITNTNGGNYHYVWQQGTGLQFLTPSVSNTYYRNLAITDDGNTVVFVNKGNLTGQDPQHIGMVYRKNLSTNVITSVGNWVWGDWTLDEEILVNSDASRIVKLGTTLTNGYHTGVFVWDAGNNWRQAIPLPYDYNTTIWMDKTGYRWMLLSFENLMEESPSPVSTTESMAEFFFYDEGLGFSRLTNRHSVSWGFGNQLSDDGTRAAMLLNESNDGNPTSPIVRCHLRQALLCLPHLICWELLAPLT
jgi:hypothetical protein